MNVVGIIFLIIASVVAVVLLPFVLWKLFKGIGWLVSHVFAFIGGMLGDTLRLIGGVITSIVFVPLVVMNVAIGRWSASKHFWRAFQDEVVGCGHCVYRLAIGHPARLLMLTPLTEGIERRIPEAIAQAPTSDTPSRRVGVFEGYTITGSLKGGGSGGKLYIARPDKKKQAAFARRGHADVTTVVIKSFSVREGSTLPQIVRESRALEAARDLGIVLDHELTGERFFYAMEYVPGDSLTVVTDRLHARSGAEGLGHDQLRTGLNHIADLLRTLSRYHEAGLWHKDIKPDNIIVGSDGRAHLVDLGLVTPLRSAMTLTTHGTEYFRDPELVRLALRGVKVHEVPGVKFDVYGAGACLYALVERSFPAHGGLSQISRKCPESIRWITRRSMAEIHQRYTSASEMLADVEFVRQAPDPFAVKPAELPSMRSGADVADLPDEPAPVEPVAFTPPVRTPVPPVAPAPTVAQAAAPRRKRVRLTDWWTGRYRIEHDAPGAQPATPAQVVPVDLRRPAADQLRHARERVSAAQARARARMGGRVHRPEPTVRRSGNKAFLAFSLIIIFFLIVGGLGAMLLMSTTVRHSGGDVVVSTNTTPRWSVYVTESGHTEAMSIDVHDIATYDEGDGARPYSYVVLSTNSAIDSRGSTEAAQFVAALSDAGALVEQDLNVDTEARLLSLVGSSLPGDSEATDALHRWVGANPAGFDAVIWLAAPTPGDDEAPAWEIVFPEAAPEAIWETDDNPSIEEIEAWSESVGDAIGDAIGESIGASIEEAADEGDSWFQGWWSA